MFVFKHNIFNIKQLNSNTRVSISYKGTLCYTLRAQGKHQRKGETRITPSLGWGSDLLAEGVAQSLDSSCIAGLAQ